MLCLLIPSRLGLICSKKERMVGSRACHSGAGWRSSFVELDSAWHCWCGEQPSACWSPPPWPAVLPLECPPLCSSAGALPGASWAFWQTQAKQPAFSGESLPPVMSVKSSIVDPKFFYFQDFDLALTLLSDSDPVCLWKIHLKCRSSEHHKKSKFLKSCTFLDPDCLWKIHLNCRPTKHRKKPKNNF